MAQQHTGTSVKWPGSTRQAERTRRDDMKKKKMEPAWLDPSRQGTHSLSRNQTIQAGKPTLGLGALFRRLGPSSPDHPSPPCLRPRKRRATNRCCHHIQRARRVKAATLRSRRRPVPSQCVGCPVPPQGTRQSGYFKRARLGNSCGWDKGARRPAMAKHQHTSRKYRSSQ